MRHNERRIWLIGLVIVSFLAGGLSWLLWQAMEPRNDRTDTPNGKTRSGGASSEAVARVNGEIITIDDFYDYASRYFGAGIVRQMIDMKVVELEAAEAGIAITGRDVRMELLRMQRGYDSEDEFYRTMFEQLGMNRVQLEADIRQRLLLDRVAVHDVSLTEEEVQDYINSFPDMLHSLAQYQLHTLIVSRDDAAKVDRQLADGVGFDAAAESFETGERMWSGDLGWVEGGDPFVPYEILEAARSLEVGGVARNVAMPGGDVAFVWLKGRKFPTAEERDAAEEQMRLELALSKAPPIPELLRRLREKWGAELIHPDFSIDNPESR